MRPPIVRMQEQRIVGSASGGLRNIEKRLATATSVGRISERL